MIILNSSLTRAISAFHELAMYFHAIEKSQP